MDLELNRLATFVTMNANSGISPIQLARRGFYYSSSEEEIVCFLCNARLSDWNDSENLSEEHRRLSPQCSLLTGTDKRSVPSKPVHQEPVLEDHSKSSINNLLESVVSRANAKVASVDDSEKEVIDFESLRCESVRLSTFVDWPPTAHADPAALARQGLFYTGVEDRVQCAFCRGALKRWEITDTPEEEHCRHFPLCPFVRKLDVGNVPVEEASVAGATWAWHSLQHDPIGLKTSTAPVFNAIDRMQSPGVRAVLEMGYSMDLVAKTLDKRIAQTGAEFSNVESLLEALFLETDKEIISNSESEMDTETSGISSAGSSTPAASGATSSAAETDFNTDTDELHQLVEASSSRDSESFESNHSSSAAATLSRDLLLPSGSGHQSFGTPLMSIPVLPSSSNWTSKSRTASISSAAAAAAEDGELTARSLDVFPAHSRKKKVRKKKKSSKKTSQQDQAQDEKEKEKFIQDKARPSLVKSSEEAVRYMEENQQLRDARTCKVCMDADIDTVFLPCGHLICCSNCSPHLRNCPICRTFIRGTVKTSLSN